LLGNGPQSITGPNDIILGVDFYSAFKLLLFLDDIAPVKTCLRRGDHDFFDLGDHKLGVSIFLHPHNVTRRRQSVQLAAAQNTDAFFRKSIFHQITFDRSGALLPQFHIVLLGPANIGVARD